MIKWATGLITHKAVPLILLAVYFIVLPAAAWAAGDLSCNNGGVAGGSLFNVNANGLCESKGNFLQHLFSNIICLYTTIINQILDAVYCGVQSQIKSTLQVVIVLYIAIFGVQSLLGHTQLTAGEACVRAAKIMFVWLFATNASYGIGIGFNFFIGGMSDGIMWVVNAIKPGTVAGGNVMGAYKYIDTLIFEAITGPFTEANSKVVGFFLVMLVVFPPLFMLGVSFVWETAMLLVSCVVIFLLSISAVAFLISLSPIFLGFMLFQSTNYLFENWLRYMMSYTLQVVIVFAVVTMWTQVILQFITFFNDLSLMLFPYKEALEPSQVVQPTNNWAVCPPVYGVDNFGPTAQCDAFYPPNKSNPKFIPPSKIMEIKGFLYYVTFHMISLIMIAYAFRVLLKNASQIARDLVGPAYVPMLGKGFGAEALGSPTGYPKKMHMGSSAGPGPAPRR